MTVTGNDPWAVLRAATRARVALGRAGDGLPTARELEFRLAHAVARDAVHTPLDPAVVRAGLDGVPVVEVRSAAADRAEYLQRPDLGRRLAPGCALPREGADVALVLADGLSPRAVHEHGAALVTALLDRLTGWSVGPVVLATQARVALGDEIGAALGARVVLVLIGERPGLSSADSLGVYLTWDPRPGRADSERNCVSNVRPPHGLGYAEAADVVARLLASARELGASGVALKDEGPALPAG
ncbi:ethanolamine ammonia-lyase subunit EutC [Blastococcus sp. MG754426]|uniref:ethanolamine ammonia-lyase subunit EutC n=1 Tax=unclassified Blastococcus TaxID=2619396 RepID=UPI001EF05482|nr:MULTISPECIES: ethanolamine ammonia-lyase subunit EutC [unclassified Blastococcus]MCF6506271.1 ethanolamine ammonia-lyase subunit EutC [Blastococcus sp. MG754426]MCF6510913.1 ethanolamine ammonia-lyase subunit EutC [Blastococcus sp. MG754427]MCF6733879.1 ethanolamine ammonia-lyase subunit EutC [Blastococcus sp. KM273129]